MGKKPLIGITPWVDDEKGITYIKKGYMEGIGKAGGLAVLLPLTTEEEVLLDFLERCDGFLLPGGPDVDAKHYGEPNLWFNGEISPLRDTMELFLAKKALEYNKPLFGICRGIQVMNAAVGGTLFQDIHSQIKGVGLLKHSQSAPKWYPIHDIFIEKESIVRQAYGKDTVGVNSFHHQAVRDVAPEFAATSKTVDGIVESIEHKKHRFAVGVQWHPELMWQEDPVHLKLFEMFVEAARRKERKRCPASLS